MSESGERESANGHDAATSAAVGLSLSPDKHIQAEAEAEADPEAGKVQALIAALEAHCAPARRSQRAETPQIARELLAEGATPDMIRKRYKLLNEKYNTSTKAYIAVTPHVLWDHWDEVKSSTDVAAQRHATTRQNDEDLAARRREAKRDLEEDLKDDAARLQRYQDVEREYAKRAWREHVETGRLTEDDIGEEAWADLTPAERKERLRHASA